MHNSVPWVCILLFLSLFCSPSDAARGNGKKPPEPSYLIELLPAKVNPGDAFVIKAKGYAGAALPEGTFMEEKLSFDGCGSACFFAVGAVDAGTKPGRYPVSMTIGGKKLTRLLTVRPAAFRTIRLTLPEEKVSLSAEDLRRAKQEEDLLRALWETRTGRFWAEAFQLPLMNELSTPFGTKRIINQTSVSIHRGVDIKGAAGDPVVSSNSGKVVLAETLFFGGNTIVVDHGLGIFSVYMHLSAFAAAQGDMVSKGDCIGYVGSTGRSSGPHLHFGIKVGKTNVNPVSFMNLVL